MKARTGGDFIRSMSNKELSDWFCTGRPCTRCEYRGERDGHAYCKLRDFLDSPYEETDIK